MGVLHPVGDKKTALCDIDFQQRESVLSEYLSFMAMTLGRLQQRAGRCWSIHSDLVEQLVRSREATYLIR